MAEAQDTTAADRSEGPTIRSPFIEHLGIRFVRASDEEVELHLPIVPEFLNSMGIVHGGVYASLADTALGAAIYARLKGERVAMTMEMSCRYIRGARAGVLQSVARVLHLGRSTAVAEAEVFGDGVLQFKASGTFMLAPRP
jgi:acyl-CoA thioesterase